MDKQNLEKMVKQLSPWFYSFDLGQGVWTRSKLPETIETIHETRWIMVQSAIQKHFGNRLQNISAIDVGCHEGYFSFMLAKLGVKSVLGIDVREENVEKANLVRQALGLENPGFATANCSELTKATHGEHELTLFLGLLYHLENPILCLRRVYEITKELLIVETQVIDSVYGETEWGSREYKRQYRGVFAVIDESAEYNDGSPEAGGTSIGLCPSMEAIYFVLQAVGFKSVEMIEPPQDGYEQHRRKKRIVVAARK